MLYSNYGIQQACATSALFVEILSYDKSNNICPLNIFYLIVFTQNNALFVNASLFEGKILTWKPFQISIDAKGYLHGVCGLNLIDEHVNKTATPEFFHWSYSFISGRFIHGQIKGLVLSTTWEGTIMYFNVKNGVLHGPAFATLRQPVYEFWVCFYSLSYHNHLCIAIWHVLL